MLPFQLGLIDGPVHIVALGAHPDDIEIGCGGTLIKLAESVPELSAEFVIATGTPVRLEEARRQRSQVMEKPLDLPGDDTSMVVAI